MVLPTAYHLIVISRCLLSLFSWATCTRLSYSLILKELWRVIIERGGLYKVSSQSFIPSAIWKFKMTSVYLIKVKVPLFNRRMPSFWNFKFIALLLLIPLRPLHCLRSIFVVLQRRMASIELLAIIFRVSLLVLWLIFWRMFPASILMAIWLFNTMDTADFLQIVILLTCRWIVVPPHIL